ncbi:hypothetical protein RM704_10515 [Streptomyces sp. DSM 3412]|uniref:Uncharacterized protein n=1 Tax=Streptomyces gottesmaniae TaxID=3075518 RepID=A0ABU2YUA0_9ACTN|nr:hypothetical protein [Streptomyces sp. DSM 3412]MDT0567897.1 hypothetical protein [Streptomyces sp. DSM 3412]
MTFVTIGGVTIGFCILAYTLVKWWPGAKTLRADPFRQLARLLPFVLAWCYGVLAVLSIGGLVGWAADSSLWITSWLGDVALVWGVGGQGGTSAAGVSYLPLTQPGAGITLILTATMCAALKVSDRRNDLFMGMWCGITLGTSAGIAGLAAVPLAQAVNWAGDGLYGAIV